MTATRSIEAKFCGGCKLIKPLDEFYAHRGTKDGRSYQCAECRKAYARRNLPVRRKANRAYAERHPLRVLESRVSKYGITAQEYLALEQRQGGVCAICACRDPKWPRLAVDHDHATGKVRGLLCDACNKALGLFKDSPKALARAAEYLGWMGGEEGVEL